MSKLSSSTAMLDVRDVVAGYGASEILHGITLKVPAGQVTALLGANGAGKTTLMKALSGLVPVTRGSLQFEGGDMTRHPSHRRVLDGLVLVPEGRMVFPSLTVRENLRLGGINPRVRARWKRNLERVFDVFPKLRERESQAAATLSGGEQQMLAIGRGMMAEPRLMLLDEPTLGLAPLICVQIFDLIKRLRADGLTLLLAEQDVRKTLAAADYAYVIENGRVAAQGPCDELQNDPRIREAYLGL
ncbi:ABC transporter ATP-binding protein [Hydrogenophaga sp. OTU3427]|uniref:ABC transporter ATP-binding protein n=1 Tax=Hydrogenophaga sp. OTU3427 TaxID=3043856 RepID=UPI00313DD3B4